MALVLLHGMPLVTTEGAGQVVYQTRPPEFLDAVQPFLRRILAASAPSAS